MDGGRDREGRGRGRKRRRETSEKGEEGEKDLFFFSSPPPPHGPLTVSCPALQQRTRTAGPPHSTLAVTHALFDVAPRRNMG